MGRFLAELDNWSAAARKTGTRAGRSAVVNMPDDQGGAG